MKQTKSKFYAMSLLALISIVGMIVASCSSSIPSSNTPITNFEECVAAGNAIMKSKPAKCESNGEIFVEELTEVSSGKMPSSFTKEIDTGKGTLFLTYGNEKTLLSGSLNRGTPCVSWNVTTISTRDMPTSQVNIKIYDENKNKDMMCIQVVAEPQEISEEIFSTSKDTNYMITFEEETLFEGKLG